MVSRDEIARRAREIHRIETGREAPDYKLEQMGYFERARQAILRRQQMQSPTRERIVQAVRKVPIGLKREVKEGVAEFRAERARIRRLKEAQAREDRKLAREAYYRGRNTAIRSKYRQLGRESVKPKIIKVKARPATVPRAVGSYLGLGGLEGLSIGTQDGEFSYLDRSVGQKPGELFL